MSRCIALAISIALVWTASPALAQDTPAPEQPRDPDPVSGHTDAPVIVAGPGFRARAPIPAAPPEPVDLAPPGLALQTRPLHVAPRGKPPLSGPRLAGELAAGMALGSAVALGSGYVAYRALDEDDQDLGDAFAQLFGAMAVGATVYPLGVGLGVAWAGHAGDQSGSITAALGGAYLGALGGLLIGSGWGYLMGAPAGALIGFNYTRRYDGPSTGLVNVSDQNARLSMPAISVTRDPLRAQGKITSVRLVDARF